MQLFGIVFEPFNDNAFKLLIVAGLCWLAVKWLDISHSDDDVLHLLETLQITSAKAPVRELLNFV